MLANLWKYYFENDVESFQQSLANATFNPSTPAKGGYGGKGAYGGAVGSPGNGLRISPSLSSKSKKFLGGTSLGSPSQSSSSKLGTGFNLNRAAVNWRDSNGVTLLHSIASCPHEAASRFAAALLQVPSLDLFIQDTESGWTALHRALYFGNVTIARALMSRETYDVSYNLGIGACHITNGLIKIKDREGNSPFDVYAASIASRIIHRGSASLLLSGSTDDEENDASGTNGDENDDGARSPEIPCNDSMGDEVFTFGSNKNFTLGFGDEDDRQYPERVFLKRADHLMQRLSHEYQSRISGQETVDTPPSTAAQAPLAALVQYQPIIIQDVQLSKLHSAILTTDPEANLYICGFGPGGRIGTGDETTRFHFVPIYGGGLSSKKVMNIGLGQNHTIAISSQGEVFTWGANSFGQLGYALPASKFNDQEPVQLLPRQVFGIIKREIVIGAAASRVHSVVHTTSSMFTFGKNDGQLGLVDSDARSLRAQNTPRKVAASLFSCNISSVSAIDKATVCLLDNHEVWIFANYGYTKMSFTPEVSDQFFHNSAKYHEAQNQICKVTAGGDTICAMSSMGDVFTVTVSQKLQSDATTSMSSTTNPSKIRGALSCPQRVWSLRKAHMAVRDVAVGQDGSILICTNSGSVWRRVKRAKIKDGNMSGTPGQNAKDKYKFSRIGGLTRIKAVRSSTFGAYAAVRRDCDVLKTQVEVNSKTIWKDLYSLLPFHALGSEPEDSDTEEPQMRFWISSQPANDTASIRPSILATSNLEKRLATLFENNQLLQQSAYEIRLRTTKSNILIPVHEFILAGRSEVMRHSLKIFRQSYYFSIPEVITIEYDADGKVLVSFPGVDLITVLNLALYVYTDTVVDVWRHNKRPSEVLRYRQVRLEVMKIASHLEMVGLEQAVRAMVEPAKTLHHDLEHAIRQPSYFMAGDLDIELDGSSIKVHSALVCRRCPFFEGFFNGRAGGRWLSSRREGAEGQEAIKVNMKHVHPSIFQYILRYLYADIDDSLFESTVTPDFEAFIDLILDIMFLANELMLDRMQQCCQKVLGRFGKSFWRPAQKLWMLTHAVNTRNVCQLLNAVAPCSVTEFKGAALEYICLNLEGLLENQFVFDALLTSVLLTYISLLDELDDDLMLELDEVVRQNQLACLPVAKSGIAEAALLQAYPELSVMIERGRQARLDSMAFRYRSREEEMRYGGFPKVKGPVLDELAFVQAGRPSSSKGQSSAPKSPLLRARSSTADLMFDMEGDSTDKPFFEPLAPILDHPNYPVSRPEQTSVTPTADRNLAIREMKASKIEKQTGTRLLETPLSFTDQNSSTISKKSFANEQTRIHRDAKPWASTTLASHQLDLKDIMAQASSNRVSNISSSLSSQTQKPASATSSLPKMSQRARKRQQQRQPPGATEADIIYSANSSQESDGLHVRAETSKSPWRTLAVPKIQLKDILGAENKNPPISKADLSTRSKSPLTLRQTVPGNMSNSQEETNLSSYAHHRASANILQVAGTGSSTSRSSSLPYVEYTSNLSSRFSNPKQIQSIHHQLSSAEPSLNFSMADILEQQQTEKEIFREAVAKRNLQEIQEEQAFQEWWDAESRKVRSEEASRKEAGEEERGKGRGRSKARGAAAGRGRGHDDATEEGEEAVRRVEQGSGGKHRGRRRGK